MGFPSRFKAAAAAAAIALVGWLVPPAGAQSLLPNGQQQFLDSNGDPLAGGEVYFYAPGTTTAKYTYQDEAETTPNTNPVVLNSAGRATIWGSGLYREVVYDSAGTLVWDQLTYGAATTTPFGGFGTAAALASAATTDLGAISSHNVNITGTTGITSFGTSAATDAPVYLLKFSGALTVTYNATSLITPTGGNITTAANSSMFVEYLGSGNWKVLSYSIGTAAATGSGLHQQVFTSGGTFTVPSNTGPSTIFRFIVVGGGGGGGGVNVTAGAASGGGGAAQAIEASFYGFNVGETLTIATGTGGAGGSTAGGNGSNGSASTVTYSATVIVNGAAGSGGTGATALGISAGGAYGNSTATAGATGLTLVGQTLLTGRAGGFGLGAASNAYSGAGGSSAFGGGGNSEFSTGVVSAGDGHGAGGGGAIGGTATAGGAGSGGEVIVEWVQ